MLLIILCCNQKPTFMELRLFKRFLKAYGLYEEFFDELICSRGVDYANRFFRSSLCRLSPDLYFVSLINWYETSRGSHFWSMVNDAWLVYLGRYSSKY